MPKKRKEKSTLSGKDLDALVLSLLDDLPDSDSRAKAKARIRRRSSDPVIAALQEKRKPVYAIQENMRPHSVVLFWLETTCSRCGSVHTGPKYHDAPTLVRWVHKQHWRSHCEYRPHYTHDALPDLPRETVWERATTHSCPACHHHVTPPEQTALFVTSVTPLEMAVRSHYQDLLTRKVDWTQDVNGRALHPDRLLSMRALEDAYEQSEDDKEV